jgi:hypothetical protein
VSLACPVASTEVVLSRRMFAPVTGSTSQNWTVPVGAWVDDETGAIVAVKVTGVPSRAWRVDEFSAVRLEALAIG